MLFNKNESICCCPLVVPDSEGENMAKSKKNIFWKKLCPLGTQLCGRDHAEGCADVLSNTGLLSSLNATGCPWLTRKAYFGLGVVIRQGLCS